MLSSAEKVHLRRSENIKICDMDITPKNVRFAFAVTGSWL